MPKSLADGKIKLTQLASAPVDPLAITVAELTAGTDISCDILSSDYALGPTGSDTNPEKALCKKGNVAALGASNYAGSISPFRYFDEATGLVDVTEDSVFQAVKEKGTVLYLVERESSKDSTTAWETGDEYCYYEAVTDDPQRIDMAGYVKRKVPLSIDTGVLYKTVAAGA